MVTVNRFFALLLLLAGITSCARYPSDLSATEQVQAIVFEHLALDLFGGERGDDQSLRLFLSSLEPIDKPRARDVDPAKGVLDYMCAQFPSARPFSVSRPVAFDRSHAEVSTGHRGMLLRVPAVKIPNDGPVVLKASYHADGKSAAGYQYWVQKVGGRWKVIKRERLWVS